MLLRRGDFIEDRLGQVPAHQKAHRPQLKRHIYILRKAYLYLEQRSRPGARTRS
jgi:hypothetical protein